MALLVLLVLPSAQIKLGASQLNGLIGSYTSGGHLWQVFYSSTGTTTTWHTIGSDGTAQQGSRQWPATGSGDGFQDSTRLDGTTSGTVTATLTWVPYTGQDNTTDPPSSSVIVTESGNAQYGGGGLGTGSADDGWGDPPPTNQNNASSGTHYEVKDGSSGTITITKSLSASTPPNTTPNAHGGFDRIGAFVSVGLSVSGDSLTINPGNALLDSSGHYNILVGQGCTASLSGIPANSTVTYNWSVDGNKFQSWTASTSSAVLVSGLGPTTNPTAHWYWNDQDSYYNITCNGQFTPPTVQGSPPPVSIPFNVVQKVHLRVPTTTERVTTGRVQINSRAPAEYGGGFALYAGGNASQNYGIIFPTQVNTPAPFSPGIWNLVQLVTPGTWTTQKGQSEQSGPGNGVQGLDGRYPLYPRSNSNYPTGVPANNLLDGTGDDPGIGLTDSVVGVRISDNFSTYVMFQPSGSDVQWVPLWDIGWNWNANDSIPGVSPNLSWAYWNDANDAGIIRVGNSASTTTFPQWNTVH